jgi:hypothetical protein
MLTRPMLLDYGTCAFWGWDPLGSRIEQPH